MITQSQPTALPSGGEPKLIFHKYGHRYFLAEARLPRMDTGRKFYTTKEEIEIASKMSKPENIEVAAK